MAHDEILAERLREQLTGERFTERRMFGGLAFLIDGHMAVAAGRGGGLLVRVPADEWEAARGEPHVTDFVMRERRMRGWLRVEPEGLADDADLARWVAGGVAVVRGL